MAAHVDPNALVGLEPPDFEIEFLDGIKKKLSEITAEGKPVVIDFYCNFCPLCGPAAQEMDKLANDDFYKDEVKFLLINMDGVGKATEYHTAKQLTGGAAHGGAQAPAAYGIKYIPHKTLIGKSGKVIKNFTGFQWNDVDAAMEA
eukprot:TRINITY_DN8274_c0_g1_i1.p1 TRINITY_DN8274_c0_g1~~TRINITY_DN8274_c0_g1_i1.p1  ORF type:complete len:156 (+),score=46.36 TRINITY_DN8274_c0_g1_i1:36-470(+)